jgi:hypothetical protein
MSEACFNHIRHTVKIRQIGDKRLCTTCEQHLDDLSVSLLRNLPLKVVQQLRQSDQQQKNNEIIIQQQQQIEKLLHKILLLEQQHQQINQLQKPNVFKVNPLSFTDVFLTEL